MCTRYYIEKDNPVFEPVIHEMKRSPLYDRFIINIGKRVLTSGEVHPTDIVPVLAPDRNGRKTAFPMLWGIYLPDNTPLFNARSETAAEKPF